MRVPAGKAAGHSQALGTLALLETRPLPGCKLWSLALGRCCSCRKCIRLGTTSQTELCSESSVCEATMTALNTSERENGFIRRGRKILLIITKSSTRAAFTKCKEYSDETSKDCSEAKGIPKV